MGVMALQARRNVIQVLVFLNGFTNFTLFGKLLEPFGPIDLFQVTVQALRTSLIDKGERRLFFIRRMFNDGTVAGFAGNHSVRFLAPQTRRFLVT